MHLEGLDLDANAAAAAAAAAAPRASRDACEVTMGDLIVKNW
jgi:hypothetical protein